MSRGKLHHSMKGHDSALRESTERFLHGEVAGTSMVFQQRLRAWALKRSTAIVFYPGSQGRFFLPPKGAEGRRELRSMLLRMVSRART